MRMEEYLNTVTEQIRCTKAREMVSEELKDHILDQAEAYEAEGMFEEEALEKAVREMGDPVETGVSLDRIHRPQISAGLLLLAGLISLASIALHAVLGAYTQEIPTAGYGYLRNHVLYILLGYLLMLLVYRLDYSILSRLARPIAAAFLVFVFLGKYFCGILINGARLYIRIGPWGWLYLPVLMILYVPLFCGVLYAYRGEGYKGLVKILLWAVIPTGITFRIPAFSQGVILWASFVLLTAIAVCKGWYQVRKTAALAMLGVLFAAPPLIFLAAGLMGRLAPYQVMRLQAYLSNSPDYNYLTIQMRTFLAGGNLLGGSAESVTEIAKLPGFNNDYIFVSLVTSCGLLAGVLVAALLILLIVKIFQVSFGQKNQLGMILGCGCGVVLLLQAGISLGMNLGLLPTTAAVLPFFSSGGSGILVSYILLGLVLSVYRHKNILPRESAGIRAGSCRA